jgi:hypothetical protein
MKALVRNTIAATCLYSGLLFSSYACAATITFNFTGVLYGNPGLLPSSFFDVDQAISGSYSFESTTPGISAGNPNILNYDALTSLNANIGGFLISYNSNPSVTDPFHQISVINDNLPYSGDGYEVGANTEGSSVAGMTLNYFWLQFDDPAALALSSLALPLDTSQLSTFPNKGLGLDLTDNSDPLNPGNYFLQGEITSIETTTVPLPSALFLFLSGLAPALFTGFRRTHKRA